MLHFQCASPISFAPTNHKKGFQAKVNLLKFIEIYILRYDITTTFKIPLRTPQTLERHIGDKGLNQNPLLVQ